MVADSAFESKLISLYVRRLVPALAQVVICKVTSTLTLFLLLFFGSMPRIPALPERQDVCQVFQQRCLQQDLALPKRK